MVRRSSRIALNESLNSSRVISKPTRTRKGKTTRSTKTKTITEELEAEEMEMEFPRNEEEEEPVNIEQLNSRTAMQISQYDLEGIISIYYLIFIKEDVINC